MQASFGSRELEALLSAYHAVPKNRAPRLVAFTPNILAYNKDQNLLRFVHKIINI
jgi:hypothetical protein